jgi:putative inorganic carbon (HCO3(-)) transporter
VRELQQNSNIIPDSWLKYILFYAISTAFIFLNAYLVLKKDTLLGILIPFAFVIILTAVYSYDKLIWLTVIFAPLSIPLDNLAYGLPFDMHLPTEPLLFGILIIFLLSLLTGKKIDRSITRHPVAIVLYVYLGWMAITSCSSSLPIVSFKYLLTRIWFIVVFFFILIYLFKKQKNIEKFIWLFTIAFVPVILYTIIRHLGYGLYNDKAAHWVMNPFFNDHTSYGAVLAMFIPFLLGFSFAKQIDKKYRFLIWGLTLLFLCAEVLSYARAAWLGLFAAAGIWAIIRLKIKFRTILITLISLLLVVFTFQKQILQELERNSQDSSANLLDHFTSMTNISTDASNLERINRWNCAIAMFKERPMLGWGPGTYAMNYAPYQLTSQRTIISTNAGDGGNAHSEYLGALADSGVLGSLSFIAIIIAVLTVGVKAYSSTDDNRLKTLLLSALLGLITYYFHGILNNFLDMDKASIPFWGFTAIIVAIDIHIKNQKNTRALDEPGV